MISVVLIKNSVWTLALFAFYKPNSLWNPLKKFHIPYVFLLFWSCQPVQVTNLIPVIYFQNFWKKNNLTDIRKYVCFFCSTKYSSNAFCFIFLPIPTSKCLNGAIINKLQHSYNNTVLHSLNPSPSVEQRLCSPVKINLSFLNSQIGNQKRPPYLNYLKWSET